MFPSGGYFRSANCPFFAHDLCHRPYCHFRHAKPEYKPTPILPLNSATGQSKNEKCQDVTAVSKEKGDRFCAGKEKEKTGINADGQQLSTPLFKRTALEEKLIANSNDDGDMSSDSDSDHSEAIQNSEENETKLKNDSGLIKADIVSKTSGKIVPFTEEIISTASECRDIQPGHSQNHTDEAEPTSGVNTSESIASEVDDLTRDVLTDDKKSKKSSVVDTNLGVLIEDLQQFGKGVNVDVKAKKEATQTEGKDQEVKDGYKPELYQLSDVAFFSSTTVKNDSNKKKRKHKKSEEVVATKVEEKKNVKTIKEKKKGRKDGAKKASSSKEKSKIQRYKDLKKLVKDSANVFTDVAESPKKSKTVVKHPEKDLPIVQGNTNKELINKSSKKSKKLANDSEQSLPSYGEPSMKSKNIAKESKNVKCSKKFTFSKESNNEEKTNVVKELTSDVVEENMEDDSEEQELLRIFNNYSPCDEPDIGHSTTLQENPMDPSGSMKRPYSESETAAVAFKKQRVAHQPSHLIQRQPAPLRSSSTFRRLPRPLQGTLLPSVQLSQKSTQPQGEKDLVTSTHVKQRLTHYAKSAGTLTSRPRIRLEYGAKVPQTIRQRYLDKLIDEYLLSYEDQQEAFDRAEREEKSIYLKSPRRQMYINLCVNLIKKLRDGEVCLEENDEWHAGKRNPLAVKSSLPSPPKRLKIEKTEVIKHSEDVVNIKPRKKSKLDNEITEEVFHKHLQKYLLNEEEKVNNGFPRPSDIPGHAEITDIYSKIKRNLSDPTRHICCRCGKPFVILESGEYQDKEECVYHHGRLIRRRTDGELVTSYTCCQGESGCIGCSVAKAHVREIDWSKESDFITTMRTPCGSGQSVFALDCEMCYTTKGLELTRVTVVDYKMNKVYDTLVKPDNIILDYNTRFSGITEESMIGVKTTLRDVQTVLLSMIHENTILLGHSLESDLKSLKLIHSTIVDTSVVFPHRLGPPYKRALRTLMGEYVQKIIQNDEEGHDSLEDAVSCVELMLWKVKEDMKMEQRSKRQ